MTHRQLIDGPFDGAVAQYEDPRLPSIWPTSKNGQIVYAILPVAGRSRYDRIAGGHYVYNDIYSEIPPVVYAIAATYT